MRTASPAGAAETWSPGAGAWLSLDTHRLGMASGDVDGDGDDDLVYTGRCLGSTRCWRVHRTSGSTIGLGTDWGGEARFSSQAETLVLGDWDGDGLDDLGYQGLCGLAGRNCWRIHLSEGKKFGRPADWGGSPRVGVAPRSADIDGDGRDDLVYTAPCGGGSCWFAKMSTGTEFSHTVNLGRVRTSETGWTQLGDFDGDGGADLVSIDRQARRNSLQVRMMGEGSLAAPTTVHQTRARIVDVSMRSASGARPAEALVTTECGGVSCVKHLYAWSSRFVGPSVFKSVVAESTRLDRVEKSLSAPALSPSVFRYFRLESELNPARFASDSPAEVCDADPNRCA
jgi:hypothetical protein